MNRFNQLENSLKSVSAAVKANENDIDDKVTALVNENRENTKD